MRLSRHVIGAAVAVAAFAAFVGHATAVGTGGGIGDDGKPHVWAGSDVIVSTGGRPTCVWDQLTNREAQKLDGFGGQGDWDPSDPIWDEWFTAVVGGVTVFGYLVECPGVVRQFRWVDPGVDPEVLIDALLEAAEETIAFPVSAINPPVGPGGYVNLGLWLAVEPAEYADLTAVAGPAAWITATPTLTSTTFDPGDGSLSITCPAAGTPIVDLDTVDEGPCGHTYRQPGTYTITVTSRWDFPYRSSDGPGTFGPLLRVSTFTYTVREIVTVGTKG